RSMPDSTLSKSRNQHGLFGAPTQSHCRVMPSLSQLLADHGNLLILDAASTQTQVGLLRPAAPSLWQCTPDEAGRGTFVATQQILAGAELRLDDIGAFIFCEGPGSMLGVRTVAMALRTWVALKPRAVFSYQSLALAARAC